LPLHRGAAHSGNANLPIGGLSNPKDASDPERHIDAATARAEAEESLFCFLAAFLRQPGGIQEKSFADY